MKYTKKEIAVLIISAVVIGFLLFLNVLIFKNYQENQIALQKDHMLTTAKSVANSLQTYYEESLEHFDLYFEDTDEHRLRNYYEGQAELSGIGLIASGGRMIVRHGTDDPVWMEQAVLEYQKKGISEAYLMPPVLTEERQFTQFLVRKTKTALSEPAYVVAAIEMDRIYRMIVEPIRIGRYGYSMVKDYNGTILMHKSADQVGIDAIAGRRERYSEYDLELDDLERWVQEQRDNAEGGRILDSYWWEHGETPVKTRKVVAYTQVPIGDKTWIVNSTLDYNEILEPLRKTQRYVFLLTAGVVLLYGLLLLYVVGNANKSHVMEREMKHLLEMNTAWEELHRREEQIRHSDKMNTLGTMTSMIAHEFNNFLTPIMLYGEMLMNDPDIGADNRDCLTEIVEAAAKSRELTGELSRYGRAEKGTGKKIPVSVSGELERSLKLLQKTLPANIILEQDLETEESYVLMAGAGMINQVIVNLCTNAVYAMKERGGTLTVRGVMLLDGEFHRYGITVQDTGQGIPKEQISRIFTPFYTTKEAGMGTGLGLSVVQNLIHQMSGEMNVISLPEQGTRFDILLPLSRLQNQKNDSIDRIRLDGKRVYLLDPNERALHAFEKTLKPLCKKVKGSSYPPKALAEIRSSILEWDIIITDYSMPMMSGMEFAGILRSLGYCGKLLLMSGCLNQDVRWYLDNGIFDGVLEKPVTIQDIEACIKS